MNPSTPKRARRNKNSVSPLKRVLCCRGPEYIQDVYDRYSASAVPHPKVISIAKLRSIATSDLAPVSSAVIATGDIVIECKVLAGKPDQYPTHKVRLDSENDMEKLCETFGESQREFDQTSIPLDLHRLATCSATKWDFSVGDEKDAIHRCHTKGCFLPEHIYFGSKDTNKSTDFCPVWILVNGCLVNCCHHTPTCLYPGDRVPTTI